MARLFIFLVSLGVRAPQAICSSRADLVVENLAPQHQVAALTKERPRPALDDADRALWVALRSSWPRWVSRLVIVHADTVAKWNRERFRRHWASISLQHRRPGRARVDAEIRRLIRQMASHGWGAPRIHGELTKLGFVVSEATVSRYMPRRPTDPDQVQLREAFPFDTAPKYLILDRDSIFRVAVVRFVKAMGTRPRRISYRSPWHNPVAQRWFGSCRRELLEHVVVLDRRHLIRLVRSYVSYYHEDRCHLGLDKDAPNGRPVILGQGYCDAARWWTSLSLRVA